MKVFVALLILIGSGHNVLAQQNAPEILRGAAHCLVSKHFLPSGITLRLGYFIDSKSDPDNTVLYVVDYIQPGRTEGYVFTLAFTPKVSPKVFTINNNGKFIRSAKGKWGVEYREGQDPLGGIWIQEHLALAIKRIEGQPTFTLRAADVRSESVGCESYADMKK